MTPIDPCLVCSREITNPICARCNFRHVLLWLNERDIDFDLRARLLKKIREQLFDEAGNDLDCIICNVEEVCLCSYCFFKQVELILRNLKVSKSEIDDFMTFFDYNIYSDYVYLKFE